MRRCWLALVLWWAPAVAHGVEVQAVAVDGALRPGATREVSLAAVDDAGHALETPPDVVSEDGTWQRLAARDRAGVWAYAVAPRDGATTVHARVSWAEGAAEVALPVEAADASGLTIAAPTASLDDPYASVWIGAPTASALPPADALRIATSEGRVLAVESDGDRLRVDIEPDDHPYPRALVVGVADARTSAPPTWSVLRLRYSWELEVEGSPGSSVRVTVGGRTYGPVTIGASGASKVAIAQLPGERRGRVRVTEPSGAETDTPFPMPGPTGPQLIALVPTVRQVGAPTPDVYLYALGEDTRPWRGAAPTCRAPRVGSLAVTPLDTASWRVRVAADAVDELWDLRIRCSLGGEADTTVSLPLDGDVPVALRARIAPEELSTDLPIADVSVSLVNALGDRMVADGRFAVDADLGLISDTRKEGPAFRAEYRGDITVEIGDDTVRAAWFAPPGRGSVQTLEAHPGPVRGTRAVVYVRALDAGRRPLADRALEVVDGARALHVTTDAQGWGAVDVPWEGRLVPRVLELRSDGVSRRVATLPGAAGNRGPGMPDLRTQLAVRVDPGRLAQIEITVSPRRLTPGPRATALVRARLLDRSGQLARTEPPELEVSEGRLLPQGLADDGAWEYRFVPAPSFRARTVEVAARSEALDVESTRSLEIAPDAVKRWVGVSGGVLSNFGRILSPHAAIDLAWRIRLGPRDLDLPTARTRLFVRTGIAWHGAEASTTSAGAVSGRLRMDLVPIHVSLVVRQEYPAMAFWFSLGGVLAPFHGTASFDDVVVASGPGLLPPGLTVTGGYGVRVPGGEIALELKGLVLTSPGSDFSFAGQVGGLAGTVGYRVFY